MRKKDKALEELHKDPNFVGEIKEKPLTITIEDGQRAILEAIYWNTYRPDGQAMEDFIIEEVIETGIEKLLEGLSKEHLQNIIIEASTR